MGEILPDPTHLSLHLPQGKYSKRKGRFKRSDGSTSSDTTSNSFVRQVLPSLGGWGNTGSWLLVDGSFGELPLLLPPGTLSPAICPLLGTIPSSWHPMTCFWVYYQLHPLPQPPPPPAPPPAPGTSLCCLPACVISFRDSLACLLQACLGLSPTPPAGCLLPRPPPGSVTG